MRADDVSPKMRIGRHQAEEEVKRGDSEAIGKEHEMPEQHSLTPKKHLQFRDTPLRMMD